MRSHLTISAVLSISALCGTAQAQSCACSAQAKLNRPQVTAAIGGKTVCVGSTGNWQHQEHHAGATGGTVTDYKKGPTDKVDPSEALGTWVVDSNGTVTYVYNAGGGTYAFNVCTINDTTYGMCPSTGSTSTVVFTTRPGQTGC